MNIANFIPYIWLAVIVFSVIVEAATHRFVAVCILGAAFFGLLASLVGQPVYMQVLIFAAIAAVLIVLRFTALKNRLSAKDKSLPEDPEELIGRDAVVTDNLTGSKCGHIRVGTSEFPAVAGDGKTFKAGDAVRICEYSEERYICNEKPADKHASPAPDHV